PQPLLPTPPLTTAAQQLDELLADLGHIQNKLVAAGQGAVGAAEALLGKMLSSLTQDLQELGITAAPAGTCAACHKPIAGKVSPPAPLPGTRGIGLGPQPFCERQGQAYCEEDYHQDFSPRCAYCAGPIREKVLMALDQSWHPEHFFCTHCGKVFGDEGFHEQGGKPYCRQDFLAMFAPKCQGCQRPVMNNYLSALQGVWHPECFVCAVSGRRAERPGAPRIPGPPVGGHCVTAAGRRYHPEHFTCCFCLRQLHKGTFRERGDKMYCQPCHKKLFL
ncbi:Leupaxin, partial [Chaetura pelagica]